jgi:hypothetical protein
MVKRPIDQIPLNYWFFFDVPPYFSWTASAIRLSANSNYFLVADDALLGLFLFLLSPDELRFEADLVFLSYLGILDVSF